MQFAIALLVILALACAVSSTVTQGQSYDYYARVYSERVAGLIIALSVDDAFHSWWFIIINAFLCLNLISCNLVRLPQLLAKTRSAAAPEKSVDSEGDETVPGAEDAGAVFARLGMKPVVARTSDGREALYAHKNVAGEWGAWVCHLGILLLILGFSLGQATHREYTAYGVAGQSRTVGDTGLVLTIDDFRVDLREDDTVSQYVADITVRRLSDGASESAEISVNNPADMFGLRFYQNSTGWAARINVDRAGERLQSDVVCAGEFIPVSDKPELIIYLNAFYPDYCLEPGVGPMTLTGELNNPAYLYSVYYRGEILGMNVLMPGEELTIDDYTVTFTEPQSYTLIQIKRDSFTWLALTGGLTVTLGLFLAFYLQPKRVWAVREEDGSWTFHGASKKGGVLFREELSRAVKERSEE